LDGFKKLEVIAMIKKYIGISLAFILLVGGCATVPTQDIKVDAQADPKANFSGYKTYGWLAAAAIVNDAYGRWEPPQFDADAEIAFLIDRELRQRGMSQSSVDPDMVVAFAAGIDMDALQLKVNPATDMRMVENVPQGGLVVALIDSDSGFVIWVGRATAEIQEDPDTMTVKARLDYAVSKMFKKLPK
jgi:hypothetical protein